MPDSPDESGPTVEVIRAKEASLTNAVRALGGKAIPIALRWIRDAPGGGSLYDQLQYGLRRASVGRIQLSDRKSR